MRGKERMLAGIPCVGEAARPATVASRWPTLRGRAKGETFGPGPGRGLETRAQRRSAFGRGQETRAQRRSGVLRRWSPKGVEISGKVLDAVVSQRST
jgi:hypothetical protein